MERLQPRKVVETTYKSSRNKGQCGGMESIEWKVSKKKREVRKGGV